MTMATMMIEAVRCPQPHQPPSFSLFFPPEEVELRNSWQEISKKNSSIVIGQEINYWRTGVEDPHPYTMMGWTSALSYAWNTTHLGYYESYEYKVVLKAQNQDTGERLT
ncbi:MAG: hypothetical protein ACXAEI_14740, partial [Candidatus Hodarchaeales archaeon]